MTPEEIDALTDEQLNDECAKAEGWVHNPPHVRGIGWLSPDKAHVKATPPDYVHDLNAAMQLVPHIEALAPAWMWDGEPFFVIEKRRGEDLYWAGMKASVDTEGVFWLRGYPTRGKCAARAIAAAFFKAIRPDSILT